MRELVPNDLRGVGGSWLFSMSNFVEQDTMWNIQCFIDKLKNLKASSSKYMKPV